MAGPDPAGAGAAAAGMTAADILSSHALPPGYAEGWAEHFAAPAADRESAVLSAAVFRIGTEWLALPTAAIEEAAELRRIHSLPHRRTGTVLGLVNVRGELLVCVSLARILDLDESFADLAGPTRRGRLLVLRDGTGRIAVPVDELRSVFRYRPGDVKPVPATLGRSAAAYTDGLLAWEGRTIGRLDHRRIVQAVDRGTR